VYRLVALSSAAAVLLHTYRAHWMTWPLSMSRHHNQHANFVNGLEDGVLADGFHDWRGHGAAKTVLYDAPTWW
jgi:hypothetical protein